MKFITNIIEEQTAKMELKAKKKKVHMELESTSLDKQQELIDKMRNAEYGSEEYNTLLSALSKALPKPQIKKGFKERLPKVDTAITTAIITTLGGVIATKLMIDASREDFVDDKPMKIFTMFKKH
ncbi:hypothetical protein P162_0033 [Lactococcus phage P162]|uniref:Uncharacterized protein n=1 Tax=Lactococcus phage P162 TaxID=1476889 RepID=X4YH44_9CAUD|nr:hypothetical protein GJ24_gp33 [Lactococcus phage P162]AHV83230.1 hypothetical protein P162_0033 [Lactococcus phage P162]